MEPTFDVRSIAEELLTLFEGWTLHLNRRTGELLSIPEGATVVGEAIEEDVLRVQGPDWLALPDRFDIHPWSIMARFAASRDQPAERQALERAVRGRDAFRMFRDAADRLGLRDAWDAYEQAEYERLTRDRLIEHGLLRGEPGVRWSARAECGHAHLRSQMMSAQPR